MPYQNFPGGRIGICVKENKYHDKRCYPTLQDLLYHPETLACSLPLCLVWISLHSQTHLPSKDANLASANHPRASLIVLGHKPRRVQSLRDLMGSIHVRQCYSVLLSERRVKIKQWIKRKRWLLFRLQTLLKNYQPKLFLSRNLEGDVALRSSAAVYTYCKSRGLFAGVSLEGTCLIERKETNRK